MFGIECLSHQFDEAQVRPAFDGEGEFGSPTDANAGGALEKGVERHR